MDKMNPKEIKTHPTFEKLFPINEALLRTIEEDMRYNNFDLSQPVILATWASQKEPVCIDGHTRLQAAIRAGIEQVPVWLREDFETEEDALGHAIKLQSHRRNMTDAELTECINALEEIRIRERLRERKHLVPQSCGQASGRSASAKEMAQMVGCSPRKVEQVRTVLKHADKETVEAVKKNEKSINKAYQETQKKRKEAQRNEPKSDSASEYAQTQANVAEDKLQPAGQAEPQPQIAQATDTDDDENDEEIDPGESEPTGNGEPKDSTTGAGMDALADEEGYVSIKIPVAQYEALSKYDWTVEEMVEQAIDRYLDYLEQEEDCDRAEDEELEDLRASTDEDDDDQEEAADVEAA